MNCTCQHPKTEHNPECRNKWCACKKFEEFVPCPSHFYLAGKAYQCYRQAGHKDTYHSNGLLWVYWDNSLTQPPYNIKLFLPLNAYQAANLLKLLKSVWNNVSGFGRISFGGDWYGEIPSVLEAMMKDTGGEFLTQKTNDGDDPFQPTKPATYNPDYTLEALLAQIPQGDTGPLKVVDQIRKWVTNGEAPKS